MSQTRRQILSLATSAAAAALLSSRPGNAEGASVYPSKPIKIIVPSAAGGPTDVPARLASQILPKLGQPVVVENRPGAAGALGTREVIARPPPTATRCCLAAPPCSACCRPCPPTSATTPRGTSLRSRCSSEGFQILVVHPSSPWTSVSDVIAAAKANPGRFNYAQVGTGRLTHLAGELFSAGHRHQTCWCPVSQRRRVGDCGPQPSRAHDVRERCNPASADSRGKAARVGVTSRARSPLAPNIPTMIEAGRPGLRGATGLSASKRRPRHRRLSSIC